MIPLLLASWAFLSPGPAAVGVHVTPSISAQSLEDELSDLAGTVGSCGGKQVRVLPGGREGWRWDAENQKWDIKGYRGYASGMIPDPPTNEITVWADIHGYDDSQPLDDQPGAKAEFVRTLAHECLHWLCPPHAPPPPGTTFPDPPKKDNPPDGDGRAPDCNDLNYALNAAAVVCGQLAAAAQAGDVEYCKALKAAYKAMQDRWNNAGNVDTATECACGDPDGSEPWDPGEGYESCPKFPAPPGGCDGEPPYPDNKVIPDCTHACEDQ
jgi:hypothetical protein